MIGNCNSHDHLLVPKYAKSLNANYSNSRPECRFQLHNLYNWVSILHKQHSSEVQSCLLSMAQVGIMTWGYILGTLYDHSAHVFLLLLHVG